MTKGKVGVKNNYILREKLAKKPEILSGKLSVKKPEILSGKLSVKKPEVSYI